MQFNVIVISNCSNQMFDDLNTGLQIQKKVSIIIKHLYYLFSSCFLGNSNGHKQQYDLTVSSLFALLLNLYLMLSKTCCMDLFCMILTIIV